MTETAWIRIVFSPNLLKPPGPGFSSPLAKLYFIWIGLGWIELGPNSMHQVHSQTASSLVAVMWLQKLPVIHPLRSESNSKDRA